MLHPLARNDRERRTMLASIGPLWDGNEVWLVTFGGALFAAFPEAYASALSGFYLAFMAVLFALILRAVSVEFRGKFSHSHWRRLWDAGFFLSSTLATFVIGTTIGSSLAGVPLDRRSVFVGSLSDQFHPYALAVGFLAVAPFLMHGAVYLTLKTTGELRRRMHRWAWHGFFAFLTLYLVVTAWTFLALPHALENFRRYPAAWLVVVLNVLAVANLPRALHRGRPGQAFASSAAAICALVCLYGVSTCPNLVAGIPPEHSLTVRNAASSDSTLALMAWFAVLGLPFVAAYTAIVYWTFRGPVDLAADKPH